MRRGAKLTKPRVTKPPVSRKSRKNQDSRVRDLEKRLAGAQKREAEALKREAEAQEQQTATAEILGVISRSPTDVQPVFDTIVRSAVVLCGAMYGSAVRFDGELMHLVAGYNYTPEVARLLHEAFPMRPSPRMMAGRAILSRDVVQVEDALEDSDYAEGVARAGGFRSMLAAPMLRDGRPIGAIVVNRAQPGSLSRSQIELLKTFADQAAIAIENVRLFNETREALERQTATAEILSVISSSPTDVEPVFTTILAKAASLCGATLAALLVYDGEFLSVAAHQNASPEMAEHFARLRVRPGPESAARLAALERTIVHVPDILNDSRFSPATFPLYQREGARTILAVPMLRETALVGVILLWRREPRPFTDNQVALLQTFADQAVIAIENVRLFKELQTSNRGLTEALEQQTATSEILRVISRSQTDVQPVFDTILRSAVALCDGLYGVLYRYDGARIDLAASYNIRAAILPALLSRFPRRLHAEDTPDLLRSALRASGALYIEDMQTDPRVSADSFSRAHDVRSAVMVPMQRDDRVLGVIVVSHRAASAFPEARLELLKTFADQAVIAIENVRLFNEIQEKSRQLEAASRHKSEFLANMSHELRTPLNAVIGFSEVLLQRMFGELNDKQHEYLKDIYASGQHLLSLINDILDLSKIEAGRMELAPAPFHLPSALENAVTLVRERAGRHGIALQVDVDPRLGEVVGDERKIKQVLLNLLSNAVKFTPEGGRISLKAGLTDGAVEIAVTDTGIGIAPEDQDAIFEEFRQVGSDDARKREGTGLGLTLAKKFVELHGGRIWVESELGRGSTFTFTFTLPLR